MYELLTYDMQTNVTLPVNSSRNLAYLKSLTPVRCPSHWVMNKSACQYEAFAHGSALVYIIRTVFEVPRVYA